MGTSPRDRQQWAINMLKQLEQLPDVEQATTNLDGTAEDMDTTEQVAPNHQNPRWRNTTTP
jgi:hypothetical protein